MYTCRKVLASLKDKEHFVHFLVDLLIGLLDELTT